MTDFKTDASLAKKGDSAAFARLYSAVYKDLYHISLYCLKNTYDACDAVSDAVVDAFASIGNLRDENAFRQWIMKILYSRIKRKLREYTSKTVEYDDELQHQEDFDFDSVELKEALQKLDEQSRTILSLSILGGYTSDEISRIFKIKPSTVRSRLLRIKEKLRLDLC